MIPFSIKAFKLQEVPFDFKTNEIVNEIKIFKFIYIRNTDLLNDLKSEICKNFEFKSNDLLIYWKDEDNELIEIKNKRDLINAFVLNCKKKFLKIHVVD